MKKFLTSKIGNILLCIAEIIVGVLLLVNPDAVTSAFIIGAGAVMILTGIVFCTLYFVGEAEKMVIKQLLFKGLLLIILGVLCVTQYGVLLAALPFVRLLSLFISFLQRSSHLVVRSTEFCTYSLLATLLGHSSKAMAMVEPKLDWICILSSGPIKIL